MLPRLRHATDNTCPPILSRTLKARAQAPRLAFILSPRYNEMNETAFSRL